MSSYQMSSVTKANSIPKTCGCDKKRGVFRCWQPPVLKIHLNISGHASNLYKKRGMVVGRYRQCSTLF